ncbi:FtsW/RodA/SpoVE family cell cycle protein [Fervidibacillus halotolerans]|uniref:Probable peptidoglycan glycosyltransferase FtsW n=1 Tax=Fervidibacillus halotolerans TaxID=2980027 RepID=A0A9E8M0J3_9BACI|nr:FtsW/RodA/SpoVE family cell cycle protein [Fervidibacillus halotolerans]WAA13253.1 FtsW/RodA/SpoVE family cell cycle protein [Fervidibacillus halotolerans]
MIKKVVKSYDYPLAVVYILLTIFGVIMVYSASMVTSIQVYGYDDPSFFFNKQIVNLVISYIAFLFAAIFPYKILKSNKILVTIVAISLVTLIGLQFIGSNINNATSWIQMGTRSFQPSEFVKLGIIIYLAAVYAKKQTYLDNFNKGVAPPILFLVLASFLTAIQPDFGTAFIIFATGAIIIFCTGMNWKNIFRLIITGVIMVVIFSPIILWKKDVIFTENRLNRIYSYLDPFKYELGDGLQLVNSYVAIGSGGWKGLGLGKSIQKLGYLPEAHTDFIMAIIAEELGVFGVSFVLFSLCFIVLKGIHIGLKTKDPFGSLLAFGISGMIGIQTFINLGGVSGLIPITGVPLPFVSYGGSSLLFLSVSLGILMNVGMFANYERMFLHSERKIEEIPNHIRSIPSVDR